MFKLAQTPTYTWPVTIDQPADGGRTIQHTFDAVFKRVTQTEVDEMRRAIEAEELKNADMVRQVMVGWSGVEDADGPVPFSQEALGKLLEVPMVSGSIVLALLHSLSGAKRKN